LVVGIKKQTLNVFANIVLAFANQILISCKKWGNDMNAMGFWSENSVHSKCNFSLITNPAKENRLKFNIRLALPPEGIFQIAGIGSSYVCGLKCCDVVQLTVPSGNFQLRKSDGEKISFIQILNYYSILTILFYS
jgi:hypothetical protein